MLNTIKEETFYTPEELAQKFKLSLSSVYKLIHSGALPSFRLGKVYRIPESRLNTFITQKKNGAPKTAHHFLDLLRESSLVKKIHAVYLYGSYARGDFDKDSDIDLCLVIDKLDLKSRKLISSLTEEAMAEFHYEELLSVKEETFSNWEQMVKEKYPFAQNILREGIELWKNH